MDYMSLTTVFVSELVWAANQVDHLTMFEKRTLLQRAVITIHQMREQASIPVSPTEKDQVSGLQVLAEAADAGIGDQIRTAVVHAANIIQTLRIHLEAKSDHASAEGGL